MDHRTILRRLSRSLPLLVLATSAAPSARAGTHYVDANANTGANDGSSWINAFQGSGGLQNALAAAVSGDQIWVAQGTYVPTSAGGDRKVSFALMTGVAIYGGFAGGEANLSQRDPAAHVTILSGDLNGDDASNQFGDNSYHVVNGNGAASSAVLDGFTISGGNANGSAPHLQSFGGGMLMIIGSDATIAQCIVKHNRCTDFGGGVYVEQSSPSFTDVRFESNFAGLGGGFSLLNSGAPVVSRCVFDANSAARGGGVDVEGSGVAPRITNSLFHGNTATSGGSDGGGGGLYISSPFVNVDNCTIVGNTSTVQFVAGIVLNGSNSSLQNSIAYFNTAPGGAQGPSNQVDCADVRWCCVQGGYAGLGNIGADPAFANFAAGDFTLSPASPCIDAGDNDLVPAGTTLDLGLHPRFIDDPSVADTGSGTPPIVDIGAHEAPNHLYTSFCAGDAALATACPCGNFGQAGHGCASSDTLTAGALQTASGNVSPDSLVLTASEMLPSVLCIFLQGDAQNPNGVVFGDGVRCVAGHLLRLAAKHASEGVASYPEPGDLSITARSAQLGQPISNGDVRYYQTYYRDPLLDFCPPPQGDSWNVTNAIAVQW